MAKKKEAKAEKSVPQPVSDDSWKHEDDARTLTRAGEILCDPERMKHANKHVKKQKMAIESLEDLKSFYAKKFGPDGDKDLEVESED
jgi:hypothetical protein